MDVKTSKFDPNCCKRYFHCCNCLIVPNYKIKDYKERTDWFIAKFNKLLEYILLLSHYLPKNANRPPTPPLRSGRKNTQQDVK